MTPYWTKAIEAAKRRKAKGLEPFTEVQKYRASEWVTCACGKQDKRIEREWDGRPKDEMLVWLGSDFCVHVYDGRIASAERTLAKIERRAAELLKETR